MICGLSHDHQKCHNGYSAAGRGGGENDVGEPVQVIAVVCCVGVTTGPAVADDLLVTVIIGVFHICYLLGFVVIQGYNMKGTI